MPPSRRHSVGSFATLIPLPLPPTPPLPLVRPSLHTGSVYANRLPYWQALRFAPSLPIWQPLSFNIIEIIEQSLRVRFALSYNSIMLNTSLSLRTYRCPNAYPFRCWQIWFFEILLVHSGSSALTPQNRTYKT